jgi:cephalosporin hydroxylase
MNQPPEDPILAFERETRDRTARYADDSAWRSLSSRWLQRAFEQRYMYNFRSLGRPIIQTPIDMVAMQEIVWDVRPDLIIETGIAHGGSLILSAAMLALLDYCDAVQAGTPLDPRATRRRVLGIDIDIRSHNRAAIEAHPMSHRIDLLQGSSTADETIAQVRDVARRHERVLVCLDSNHTHDHVLAELEAYAPLTSAGSYCCVFDTIVEDLDAATFPDRPWKPGDNPKTAVREYLRRLAGPGRRAADGAPLRLEIDAALEGKLMLSVAPSGYLRRTA